MLKVCQIWSEVCEAAVKMENEFGCPKALDYLVGEKFLEFLEASDSDPDFREEIPLFVAAIKLIFDRWQLAEYFEQWQAKPFDPSVFDDEESAALDNPCDIYQSAAPPLLVERAKEWLLGEGE